MPDMQSLSVTSRPVSKFKVLQDLIKLLPEVYSKESQTNIYKFLKSFVGELQAIRDAAEQVRVCRDIDQATGKVLDLIGLNLVEGRNGANDTVYRVLLKSKILRNISQADINTIIIVLCVSLGTTPDKITIKEGWNVSGYNEPAAMLIDMPLGALANGFSYTQVGDFINKIVGAGIKANLSYQGTFKFSSQRTVSETDATVGMNQGILGAYYEPGS